MFDIKVTELDRGAADFASTKEIAHFQQSRFWGEFKERHGWKLKAFNISWTFTEELPPEVKNCHNENNREETVISRSENVFVMIRSFARNMFSLAYIPLYPSLPFECTDKAKLESAFESEGEALLDESPVTAETQCIEFTNLINELALALKPFLPSNTICIRFDPAVEFDTPLDRDNYCQGIRVISFADRLKVKKNKVDIQPPDSTQIDLTADEETILNRMKSKWRYNIRLAEKKGVQIERVTGENPDLDAKLDIFYDLYKITSERDGIAIHPKSYYKDLLLTSAKEKNKENTPVISLYIAKHEEDYLGAIITLFSATESIYLYGCSSNTKRNLMPNFLLQWTAMKDAKEYGSYYYDMYGMPPTDDENHPMHGLYLFKTGFGGHNIHRPGTFDVPLSAMYGPATFAENARAFWHKKIMKKIRGR